MLVHSDSLAYCTFAKSALKRFWYDIRNTPVFTAGASWWDETRPFLSGPAWTGTGTLTGLIDVGPYPGTSSLHFKQATPLYAQSIYAGPNFKSSWIPGLWVYCKNFTTTHTILVWQNSVIAVNYGTVYSLGIRPDGKVVLNLSAGPNVNVDPASFDPQNKGGILQLVSNQAVTMNTIDPTPGSLRGWSHICCNANLLAGVAGNARLFINGCNDSFVSGQNYAGANLLTLMWNNPSGPDEICISQLIVNDNSGTNNNTQVSQYATMQVPFPNSDALAQWSSTQPTGYQAVDGNPGPGTEFISLPSLANPDELFGFPPVSNVPQVVGVAINLSMLANSVQSVAGLYQVSGHSATPTPTIAVPSYGGFPVGVSDAWTQQAFSELNPWTGLPWTIADINAAKWGVRGISGINEEIGQSFLEVIGQTGPANCGGSYAY